MIMLQRCSEEMFAGHKHHDIIGRILKLAPIGFVTKRIHMVAHRGTMRREMQAALCFINGTERILIGIERDLCINHQRLPARHANDDIGPHPPRTAFDAHFRLEITMFGKTAAFQNIAQLLLTPAPARLGGVAQRIDQLGGFAGHPFRARPHRLNLAVEQAKGIAPFALNLGHTFLIAQQAIMNRLEQGLQFLPRSRFGLFEPFIRAFQKLPLRRFEQLAADFAKLRRERILAFPQFCHPRVKTFRLGLQPDKPQPRRIAFAHDPFKIDNRLLEVGQMQITLNLERPRPAPAKKPADEAPNAEDENQCE